MNRGIMVLGILLILGGAQAIFAQSAEFPEPVFMEAEAESSVPGFWFPAVHDTVYLWALNPGNVSEFIDFIPLATLAAAADSDAPVVPSSVRNNRYYQESVRLTQLAQQTYDGGDYDASADYAAEALRYAQLSDEFVARQLKIRETNDAIAAARKRLDWAASVNAAGRYPAEYGQAQSFYTEAVNYRAAESWDPAIAAARRVINALANVTEAGAVAVTPPPVNNGGRYSLPAQYTVRPWASSKDCLWNIAGRPWAYGDPTKWRILYDANKSRMPDPNNPDLIHPGMVLDIPSIRGEARQGMWDAGRTYDPLR